MVDRVMRRRASRILVLMLLGAAIIGGTAAISLAVAEDTIELEIFNGNTGEFRYADETQALTADGRSCALSTDSVDGPIMEISGTTYKRNGTQVLDATVGIVGQRLGTDKQGQGGDSSCGFVDWLSDVAASETLSMTLGASVDKLIDRAELQVNAKSGDIVIFEFQRNGVSVADPLEVVLTSNGDQSVVAQPTNGQLFDQLTISAGDPGNIGTLGAVFYLKAGQPDVVVSAVANEGDNAPSNPNYIPVGTPVTWKVTLTNTGQGPATGVVVNTIPALSLAPHTGDANGNEQLDVGETWIYVTDGTDLAEEGEKSVLASVAINETDANPSDNSDTASYFGSTVGMTIDAETAGYAEGATEPYEGHPDDGVYIATGDTVVWTYTVTNTGNVPLTNIAVTDDDVAAHFPAATSISCAASTLAESGEEGDTTVCSASATAENGTIDTFFTNSASATGTPPTGAGSLTDPTDTSSYFGYDASLSITATLNGVAVPVLEGEPNPVVVDTATWVFTINNNGNIGVDGTIVTEDGSTVVCDEGDLGTVPPGEVEGNPATCTVTYTLPPSNPENPDDSEVTTTFVVTGTDPNGNPTSDETESITYFIGLDCGGNATAGGPLETDDPRAGFVVGPLKVPSDCAVPVEISTANTLTPDGGEQTVFIGPPDGYNWTGVTGLLTVEWDVEDPAVAGVRPTFQDLDGSAIEIPLCGGDVAVDIDEPGTGEWLYSLNPNPGELNGTYPLAAGDGDICLVQHTTKTINFIEDGSPTVKTLTVEVFYIYNDPILIRPR